MNKPYPKRRPPKILLSPEQMEIDRLAARRVELSEETLEAYQRAMNPGYPFWHRVRMFFRAENEAGRIAKIVKDAALVFVPYGKQIDTAADFITTRIEPTKDRGPMLTKAFKRAFTKDGGGWIRIRDEDGKFSKQAILATIIRLVALLLLLYGGKQLGLPVDTILTTIGLQ